MNLYDVFMSPLEIFFLKEIRKVQIPKAFGKVLEIGAGTGANFEYYNINSVSSLSILDTKINKTAKQRAPKNTLFIQSNGTKIPFEDETFDTVVETFVLCSVDDETVMIREIERVLKPNGIFIHLDHGLPDDHKLKKLFIALAPAWQRITKSCQINKNQKEIIEKSKLKKILENTTSKGIFYWGIHKKNT